MVRQNENLRQTLLKFAIYNAAAAIKRVDGRVAGIKFNKLMFRLGTIEPRLRLPYRWYLYGAVLDSAELKGFVDFNHPDDETKTTVNVPYKEPPLPPQFTDVGERLKEHCAQFATEYAGPDYFYRMLEDHYRSAPLDFQRAYLNTTKVLEELASPRTTGLKLFSQMDAIKSLSRLESDYLKDGAEIEPRLKESALRVFLAARLLMEKGDYAISHDLLFDFWKIFCLFLSARKHAHIQPHRLESYLARAENDLKEYRRRLPGELDALYREIGAPESADQNFQAGLARAAMEEYDRRGGS